VGIEGQGGDQAEHRSGALRFVYLIAGFLLLGLGIIGAFLPLLPTTIFVILAAGCFARSNRRIESWLLAHKRFGPMIVAWREEGAIPRRGKVMACIGMGVGFIAFLIGAQPGPVLMLFVLAFFLACAWYVVTRPEPSR